MTKKEKKYLLEVLKADIENKKALLFEQDDENKPSLIKRTAVGAGVVGGAAKLAHGAQGMVRGIRNREASREIAAGRNFSPEQTKRYIEGQRKDMPTMANAVKSRLAPKMAAHRAALTAGGHTNLLKGYNAAASVGKTILKHPGKAGVAAGLTIGGLSYLNAKRKQRAMGESNVPQNDFIDFLTEEKKNKKWIAGAIEKPGSLHRALKVPQGEKIPKSKLAVKSTDSPLMIKRKNLAKTLGKMHHGGKHKQESVEMTQDKKRLLMEIVISKMTDKEKLLFETYMNIISKNKNMKSYKGQIFTLNEMNPTLNPWRYNAQAYGGSANSGSLTREIGESNPSQKIQHLQAKINHSKIMMQRAEGELTKKHEQEFINRAQKEIQRLKGSSLGNRAGAIVKSTKGKIGRLFKKVLTRGK